MKGPQRSQAERQSQNPVIQSGFLHMAESFSFLCQILKAIQARVSDQPNKLKVYVHTMNLNVTILYFLYIMYRLQFSWLRTYIIFQYLAISFRPAVQRSWKYCCDLILLSICQRSKVLLLRSRLSVKYAIEGGRRLQVTRWNGNND